MKLNDLCASDNLAWDIYLEWLNNFKSISKFAAHYETTFEDAHKFIIKMIVERNKLSK